MPDNNTLLLYAQAAMYILLGLMHFIRPSMYLPIMPPYLPLHKTLVWVSGGAEVLLGIGLLTEFRSFAAWGIIGMLLVFLLVHEWMLRARLAGKRYRSIPVWVLAARIPLQFWLMYWAYIYT